MEFSFPLSPRVANNASFRETGGLVSSHPDRESLSAAIIGSPDLYYYRILGFTQIFGFYFPVFWYVIPCGPCFQALLRYDILNAGVSTPVKFRPLLALDDNWCCDTLEYFG